MYESSTSPQTTTVSSSDSTLSTFTSEAAGDPDETNLPKCGPGTSTPTCPLQ